MIISFVNPTCRYVQMPTAKLHLGRVRIIEGLTGGIPAFKTRMEKQGSFGFFDFTRNMNPSSVWVLPVTSLSVCMQSWI